MKKIINFVKKETVLTVAWILAIISAFFVKPSMEYIDYIDFRTLGILWSLMIIMAGLRKNGFFEGIGDYLLKKTDKVWKLAATLVFLCFFFSMFITNDVALITFVPFAMFMLAECGREDLLIPVIVLQTLAANLGNMLTPIGNPQNLYLYGVAGMSIEDFTLNILPYTATTFVMLVLSIFLIKGKNEHIDKVASNIEGATKSENIRMLFYGLLFVLALFVVGRFIPYLALVVIVLIIVAVMDREVLLDIDYALLFTFIGFFVFTGNLGNLKVINEFLTSFVEGREVLIGIVASQFISNVPAALLLSSFTSDYSGLLIGVNLGGLGTLIASMASLISFKSLAHNYNEKKGKYFLVFTGANLLYLAVLLGVYFLLHS